MAKHVNLQQRRPWNSVKPSIYPDGVFRPTKMGNGDPVIVPPEQPLDNRFREPHESVMVGY
jgi:hypothetical protein